MNAQTQTQSRPSYAAAIAAAIALRAPVVARAWADARHAARAAQAARLAAQARQDAAANAVIGAPHALHCATHSVTDWESGPQLKAWAAAQAAAYRTAWTEAHDASAAAVAHAQGVEARASAELMAVARRSVRQGVLPPAEGGYRWLLEADADLSDLWG